MSYPALKELVEAYEQNINMNHGSWRELGTSHMDADDLAEIYDVEIDDDIRAIVARAIESDGKSLPAELRAAEKTALGVSYSGHGYWIAEIERKYAAGAQPDNKEKP